MIQTLDCHNSLNMSGWKWMVLLLEYNAVNQWAQSGFIKDSMKEEGFPNWK